MRFKCVVLHNSSRVVGGGEILANYLGKALNCKVCTIGPSRLGFEDISYLIPRSLRALNKLIGLRSIEYILWSSLDIEKLGDFDVVITSGPTPRAIITPEYTMHVNYCHSPLRWLYDLWNYRRRRYRLLKPLVNILGEFLRVWDGAIDSRVDYYFVNSEVIQRRLWKYLKRDSVVLYPPIEWSKYKCRDSDDYLLIISRLEPEKRVEDAIRACIKAGVRVVVAGSGSLYKQLSKKYGNNKYVELKGFVDEKEKIDLLAHCKAVLYPPIAEDFGIVPVEALASGKPVIVDNSGFPPILLRRTGVIERSGILEVCKGGIITKVNNLNLFAKTIQLIDKYEWDSDYLREFAKQFDFEVFKVKLQTQLTIWLKDVWRHDHVR